MGSRVGSKSSVGSFVGETGAAVGSKTEVGSNVGLAVIVGDAVMVGEAVIVGENVVTGPIGSGVFTGAVGIAMGESVGSGVSTGAVGIATGDSVGATTGVPTGAGETVGAQSDGGLFDKSVSNRQCKCQWLNLLHP